MKDQIIVAVFRSRNGLVKAMDHLLDEVKIDVQKAAVITKTQTGEVRVLNDDLGSDEGNLVGTIIGAVLAGIGLAALGAWTLPGLNLYLVLGVGSILGGILGGLVGRFSTEIFRFGFDQPYVDVISNKLQEGTTALLIRVEDAAELLPRLQDELAPFQAILVQDMLEFAA